MSQKNGEPNSHRPPRKIGKLLPGILSGIVVFLLVAYLGVSAYAANALTRPARTIDKVKYNPGVYGLTYEEVTYPSRDDGLEIAAWYIPSAENQRAIILVHGYNNSRTNGFLDEFVAFGSKLQQAGFSIMMIDLRGHGESADARFTFGVSERRDVLGAVDWLEGRGYQPGRIGVLGYSLGAGSVIGAAAEEPDIGAIWGDSLFADIKPVLEGGWTSLSGLPQPFLYSTEAFVRILYGFDISASRPIEDIGKISPRPIFLTHCQNDQLIPVSNLDELVRVAQNVQTWIIPNCDIHTVSSAPEIPEIFNNHAIGYYLNQAEYTSKVVKFFDENLE